MRKAKSSDTKTTDVIKQLENGDDTATVSVDGHRINFTGLNKQLWPKSKGRRALTKRDYALYLTSVSPWLIPHLEDRPITFVRFPNGIDGNRFYQRHWESNRPSFVKTVPVFSQHVNKTQDYLICDSLAALLWLAQIADLELHVWQSRVNPLPDAAHLPTKYSTLDQLERSLLNYPDYLLFDLDPYLYSGKEQLGAEPELHRKGFRKTCQTAKWINALLEAAGLKTFVKTTGRTGLHIYVPIVREFTFTEVRLIAKTVAQIVLGHHPSDVTTEWSVVKRQGKVFIDYNMNSRSKTLASIYSLRASHEAAVSWPVQWDELDDVYPSDFNALNVPDLLRQQGDAWQEILRHKNDLEAMLRYSKPRLAS